MLSSAVTPESTLTSKLSFDALMLTDSLPLLKLRLKECITDGKLLEAEVLKQKIAEAHVKQRQAELSQLRARQAIERETVQTAHLDDYREFNEQWDNTMTDYTRESEAQINDLKNAHEVEQRKKLAQLELSTPTEAKLSPSLLNMQRKLDAYVKASMYLEAHSLNQEIESKKILERKTWEQIRNTQIQKKLHTFIERQQIEAKALRDKLKKGYDELMRRRGAEMETVIKRYQNNAKQLKISQSIEKNKRDGLHTTSAGCSTLEVGSISRILASSRAGTPSTSYRPKQKSRAL